LRRSKQTESRNKIPQTFFIHEKAPKAAWGKKNPQFLATMNASAPPPRRILYDKLVIARGKIENKSI
jgi:hypothetical protein